MIPDQPQVLSDGTVIRPYREEDKPRVREICADTGWLGKPIDPVFEDRELFADFLTTYYLDYEPDSCWVAEQDGKVVAYAIGSVRPDRQKAVSGRIVRQVGLKGFWRLVTCRYGKASRKFLWWVVFQSNREEPKSLPNASHLHWNMLPDARGKEIGKCFLETFIAHSLKHGMKEMFGHMTVPPGKRSTRIFERMGWNVIDRKEQTKFKDYMDDPVFTVTLYRRLSEPTGRKKTEENVQEVV